MLHTGSALSLPCMFSKWVTGLVPSGSEGDVAELVALLSMSQELKPPRAVHELEAAAERAGRRLPAAHGDHPAGLLLSHLQQELKSESEIGGVGCLV